MTNNHQTSQKTAFLSVGAGQKSGREKYPPIKLSLSVKLQLCRLFQWLTRHMTICTGEIKWLFQNSALCFTHCVSSSCFEDDIFISFFSPHYFNFFYENEELMAHVVCQMELHSAFSQSFACLVFLCWAEK